MGSCWYVVSYSPPGCRLQVGDRLQASCTDYEECRDIVVGGTGSCAGAVLTPDECNCEPDSDSSSVRSPSVAAEFAETSAAVSSFLMSDISTGTPSRSGALAESVHRVVGVASDVPPEKFLTALEAAITASDHDDARLSELVDLLNRGTAPAVLRETVLNAVPLLHPYRHQKLSSWRYGTFRTRQRLIAELFAVAKNSLAPHDGSTASRYARAAFLLAAQDTFFFGAARMTALFADPDFRLVSAWTEEQLSELESVLALDQEARSSFSQQQIAGANALQVLINTGQDSWANDEIENLFSAMNGMATSAVGRHDLQWRQANFVWRLASLAKARNDGAALERLSDATTSWSVAAEDVTVTRWLAEAISETSVVIKTVGFRLVSNEGLEQLNLKSIQ